MRRAFFRRVGLGVALFFAFIVLVGSLSTVFFHGGPHGPPAPRPHPVFLLVVVLGIVGFVLFGRAVRGTARPIGDVMDAASRVAGGDYSARARVSGPPEVRDLATAFNEMAAKIEAGELQRRNLLADVTHELRTPLSVVRGRIEGMLDGVYEPTPEHLELVVEQTRVLARLLDDLSLLSKAEAGALSLERERVGPADLVRDAAGAYRAEAEDRGLTLTVSAGDHLPSVDVDRVRIGEVLSNLLANALRYTPRGGSILLSAAGEGDAVAFEVADTGPGIAPERLARVFDRFAKSADSRGSGLGLAIARSLVEAHGGTISARSGATGTTMRFVLPAAR
jgi:signal transduction histidine kinase